MNTFERPIMFDTKKAAAMLGLSVWTLVNNRSKNTGIPYVRMGGRIYYLMTDIEEWLKGQRIVPSGNKVS